MADARANSAETQVDQARSSDVADAAGLRDVGIDARDATSGGDSSPDVRDAPADSMAAADSPDGAVDSRDALTLTDTNKPDSPAVAADVKDASIDVQKLDGTTDLPWPNSCLHPLEIPMDNPTVDLAVTTTGQSHKIDLPCSQGGPDLVLTFNLLDYELVYADTFGASWKTVLQISKTCPPAATTDPDAGTAACSAGACNTSQSQVSAVLPNHRYYLILSGSGGDSGDATVHFQHAPVGTGPANPLAPGTASVSGATVNTDSPPDISCEYPGPSSTYYWVTCPDYLGGALAASTCTSTQSYDTALSLQIPRTGLVSCVDDTDPCGQLSSMNSTIPPGAGINILTVGGGSSGPNGSGPYVLTYTIP